MRMDTDTMLRLLRGELSESEARKTRDVIAADPNLAAEFRRIQCIESRLKESAADSFGPYFSDRVMKRILSKAAAGRSAFYESLQWVFVRLAVASVIVVVGLGFYSAIDARESEFASNTIEAVFGLPSADLESLFYLQGI